MSYSLATSSVGTTPIVANFTLKTAHPKNETAAQAVNIGDLTEQSDIVSVSATGSQPNTPVASTFTAQTGDLISLAQNFGNIVDKVSTRYQLFDSSGNVIADNQGTTAQQWAYTQWVRSGLVLTNSDTYTAVATPTDGSAAAIETTQTQGSSLQVKSKLTGSDPSEYYNFNLSVGNNIKLAFDAGTSNPSTRVQLLDSNGNVIADSAGSSYEKANFQALTSGSGLTASPGKFTVKVSYAANVDPTSQDINYNFQLYSGSTYSLIYKNNVTAQATDTTAVGSVTPASSQTPVYSRQAYNTIGETAASAINIGWLLQDKSALQAQGQLTSADNADFYSFTLQAGDNLKFGFDNTVTTNPAALRVQLFDVTGSNLLADSQGTADQQAAYKKLTTTNGLPSKAGSYLVEISYGQNAKQDTTNYQFGIYSGTSYSTVYKTIASAQTYGNALLSGNVSGGYAQSSAIASYLAAQSPGLFG